MILGTNYYVRTPACADACAHCSESQLIHLGKSSVGWKFSHKADPDWLRTEAHKRWLQLAASGPIENEYGQAEDLDELLKFIAAQQGGTVSLRRPRSEDHRVLRPGLTLARPGLRLHCSGVLLTLDQDNCRDAVSRRDRQR